jgi:hypothetical protein
MEPDLNAVGPVSVVHAPYAMGVVFFLICCFFFEGSSESRRAAKGAPSTREAKSPRAVDDRTEGEEMRAGRRFFQRCFFLTGGAD